MSKAQKDIETQSIIAFVFSFFGLGIIGGPLGVITLKKSRQKGFGNNPFAIIAIIYGLLSYLIILSIIISYSLNSVSKNGDTTRITAINNIHAFIEIYNNQQPGYPAAYPIRIDEKTFAGESFSNSSSKVQYDAKLITGTNGSKLTSLNPVKDKAAALASPLPTIDSEYQYIPYGCSATACTNYVLSGYIDRAGGTFINPYTKIGLNDK